MYETYIQFFPLKKLYRHNKKNVYIKFIIVKPIAYSLH